MDLMKLKSFCTMKETISKVKRQSSEWEKIIGNETTDKVGNLSITNSWSLLQLTSIESVIPSNHLILCHPVLLLPSIFPSIRVFPVSQSLASGGQSTGVSPSASVLPMNIQGWFPLGLNGLISLQSRNSPKPQFKNKFLRAQLSLGSNTHIHTWLLENP